MIRFLSPLLFILIFTFSGVVRSEESTINSNPLAAEVKESELLIEPGQMGQLTLQLKIAEEYHAYLERFKLIVTEPQGIKVSDFRISPIVKFYDAISKSDKDGVKGQGELVANLLVPEGFGSGVVPLNLALTYQACTDEHCLFPKTIHLLTQLNTSGQKGAIAPLKLQKTNETKSEFATALEKSIFSALILAFLFGLATSLTPCIYPMIPITLAVLGARKSHQSHTRGFFIALTYVLGIALTYATLGLLAASTGEAFGRALGNSSTVSVIAIVFVLMGLSMYGFIEFQVPTFIQNRVGFAHKSSGFAGAFSAGLAAGIVASPCVGPVLVSILTYIAQTQDLVFGFVFLFVFALGIGFPFLILGTFSQLITRLPKAGSWMEFVKFAFGTVMIGMAFYYVYPVYPQWLFHLLLGLAMIFVASVYGAFESVSNLPMKPDSAVIKGSFARFRKGLMIAVLITGTAFFAHGVMSRAGVKFATNTDFTEKKKSARNPNQLPFEEFSMEKLYIAQKDKRPVLIDFYADWCAACKELEEYTFTDERVRRLGKEFTLLRFDATEDNTEINAILKEFNVIGLPTLVFFDSIGVQRDDERVTGFEKADRFIQRMQSILK